MVDGDVAVGSLGGVQGDLAGGGGVRGIGQRHSWKLTVSKQSEGRYVTQESHAVFLSLFIGLQSGNHLLMELTRSKQATPYKEDITIIIAPFQLGTALGGG